MDIHDDDAERRWLAELPRVVGWTRMSSVEPTRGVVVELIAGLQAEDRLTEQQHSLVLEHLDDTPPGELFEILHRWTMEAHPDVVTRARQTDIIDQAVLVCVPERRLDPRTLGALDDDLADVMSDVGHVQGAR